MSGPLSPLGCRHPALRMAGTSRRWSCTHTCSLRPVLAAPPRPADSNPSYEFGCLPASQVSGITIVPIPQASWPGCLVPRSKLAWWGVRCGPSNSQIIWTGVYAYSAITGDPLPGCVKIRDPGDPVLTDDTMYWLGETCGASPAAVPSMPGWICMDPFEGSFECVEYSYQGLICRPGMGTFLAWGAKNVCLVLLVETAMPQ
jgi:hypothetical protein